MFNLDRCCYDARTVNDSLRADAAKARWQRARALFDEVADLDAHRRRVRLDVACRGDLELRREVETLLDHDHASHDAIERAIADAACDALPEDERATILPVPGNVGHYRILERLGEGGMGEVFLAEDETLGRRVALKLPSSSLARDPESRDRLLREARAAATLNHPHVCVVHEVGEASDGRPFIAMEYLAGETLAARLTRGPLTQAEVLTLGVEATEALAAAHAHGVVHRDLKPANIILTAHGAKLLDFGLASVGSAESGDGHPRAVMGTLRYMSPEQARGELVDHRSDLYSLGLVLHEAATGRRPGHDWNPRPAGLDLVVARLLAPAVEDRYQRAADASADLARLRTPSSAAWKSWAAGGAALLVIAGLAVVASRPGDVPAASAPAATVLVGEIANTTGDAAFAGVLRQALMVQLQQTPFVRVVPVAGVRETLRQMGRPTDAPLTADLAQEVARRRGLHAWVSGTVAIEDGRHVVRLIATSGTSGDVIARGEADASERSGVLAALDRSVVQLRLELGETRRTLQQFNTPLEQATTASLDALRAYALGVQQADRGEYALAMSLYQRAVEIDPDFALAYQALASQALNAGYHAQVETAARRAFELRKRVTEQEQHRIVFFYHLSVTGDLEAGIEDALRWRTTYPDDWRAHHALSNLYLSTGDHAKAAIAARTAVKLNPDSAAVYSNLGGALFVLDRFDEAREVYRAAMARGFDTPEYHAYLWRIAYYSGDAEAMARHLDWATSSATWARNMPALAATLQGRWRAARDVSRQSVAYFSAREMTGLSALAARYDAVAAALFGECLVTRVEADRALELTRDPEEVARIALALAICGDADRAERLADDLGARHHSHTTLGRSWRPTVAAAVALARGDSGAALDALGGTEVYDGGTEGWPRYLRGLSLLRAGHWSAARVQFESITAARGRTLWVPIIPLAHLGRARAAAGDGDLETALRAYADLFALWRDADADLPVMVEARREYARLVAR